MHHIATRIVVSAALAASAVAGAFIVTITGAEASQVWHCTCNGKEKRYIASTRYCEINFKIPKGKWCSTAQWRSVYGPACAEMGCRLPSRH